MANVYFKIVNRNLSRQYTENIISDLQKELLHSARIANQNLFDDCCSSATKQNSANIESLLTYYLINQLLKNTPNENLKLKSERRYISTGNKNYVLDSVSKKYYKINNGDYILADEIIQINSDGSYVIEETKSNCTYVFKKTYNVSDEIISLQTIDPQGKIVSNKYQAIELNGMRKEFVQKYKYSGFSGNSNDVMASILNKINAPIETGYYMDRQYNLFKWDAKHKCFVKSNNNLQKSPLLIDYDFISSEKVIRKEYTGIK